MGRRDGKTEKATPRRKSEARKEGQIPRSQEIAVAASLLATLAALRIFAADGFTTLADETSMLFANAPTQVSDLGRITPGLLRIGAGMLAPFVIVSGVVVFASQVAQVGFTVKPKAAKPSLKKLSPKQGLEKLRPSKGGWELLKTALKLGLLIGVVIGPIRGWMAYIGQPWNMGSGLGLTGELIATVFLRGAGLAAVIALADYLWSRRTIDRDTRMSKQDVKQEHKSSEGDPLVRSKRRQRAQEISRNRMLRDVASADVVVTNPTHLAIALRYTAGEPAPKVLAKGADHLAARIRKIAHRNGVQVIEDKPLARALYPKVKVGGFVPTALFEGVAVVLATAYRRYGKAIA